MSAARAVALTGADQAVRVGAGTYRGLTVRETAGAAASLRVFDGTSAAGTLLETVALPANGSYNSADEVYFGSGVFVDIVAGAVEGAVKIG